MLTKDDVLREIRRTAAENGGVAPGKTAFFAATGIRESDWSGRWWTTWSAAVREAGLEPQRMNPRLPDEPVLDAAARIVRKLGRFPTAAEIRFECNADPTLPSHNTFRRFDGLVGLRTRLRSFAAERGLTDVVAALPYHEGETIPDSAMRFIAILFVLMLSESAAANVLPCGGKPARTYDDDPAPVRYAAQTGRLLLGVGLGVPIGLALAVVGVPIGAATGPLWIQQDHAVAEGALWGICPGLLTMGAFADLGYYLFGGPAYAISRVIRVQESHESANSAVPADAARAPRG